MRHSVKPLPANVHPDLLELFESELSVAQDLHLAGSVAPMAAFMDRDGQVAGEFYTARELSESFNVAEALEEFNRRAQEGLASGAIRASMILFHGYVNSNGVHVSLHADSAQAMVAWLQHESGEAVQVVIPYGGEPVFSPMP